MMRRSATVRQDRTGRDSGYRKRVETALCVVSTDLASLDLSGSPAPGNQSEGRGVIGLLTGIVRSA
jgi:hypothetical protein